MQIKNITIIGGGSAGWMTAAAMSKTLKGIEITLIESPDIPTMSVGESTLDIINEFMELVGLEDKDWMPGCSATYKTSIRFTNFLRKNYFYSDILKPVVSADHVDVNDFYVLSKLYPDVFKSCDVSRYHDDTYHMVHKNKFFKNERNYLAWNFRKNKAYHFDAFRFGQVLKDLVAIPNGVKHVQDTVIDIVRDTKGNVISVSTKNNGNFSSDLYIDCTGFKSQLLGNTLGVSFISFKDKLLNDRAVVANIPYEDKDKELTSWTECTAHDSGWFWNIPVWDRIGTGYVFSSKYVDDNKALSDFKQHLKSQYGKRADTINYNFINFEPGMREKAWSHNVVGIGISCGFLEPLRSTGLQTTQIGIRKLVNIISRANNNVKNIDRDLYCDFMHTAYTNIRDFVLLQYVLSDREDTPYWDYMTNKVSIRGSTGTYYDELQHILHSNRVENKNSEFIKILGGVNRTPLSDDVFNSLLNRNEYDLHFYEELLRNWKLKDKELQEHAETLPTLLEYLEKNIYNT